MSDSYEFATHRFLYQTVRYLKRLLTSLDKVAYAKFATKHAHDAAKRQQARMANAGI